MSTQGIGLEMPGLIDLHVPIDSGMIFEASGCHYGKPWACWTSRIVMSTSVENSKKPTKNSAYNL